MKKSTIWILTIIMALTFVGLLYMQFVYMEEMVKMREQHFSEGVKRSLYSLSTALEKNETKNYLEEELLMLEPGIFDSNSSLKTDNFMNTFLSQESDLPATNRRTPVEQDKLRKFQENLRKQFLYQKGLLNEVILTILNQSSNRPITERADSAMVNNYLRTELGNNGIPLAWEYAIADRKGHIVYKTNGYDETVDKEDVFIQTLFPNDTESRRNYLYVYFPERDKYIFSSVRFMIPSFGFTFVLLVVFLCTIVIAFRQKKLSEMKNDFINNMTHEFKTPISTISLAAQMLNDDTMRKSPTMMQHISTVINDETKRLRFQVEKVLQMSMFDRQKATLKLQEVNANQLIQNIINTFKLKVEKYGGRRRDCRRESRRDALHQRDFQPARQRCQLPTRRLPAAAHRGDTQPSWRQNRNLDSRQRHRNKTRRLEKGVRKVLPRVDRQPPRRERIRPRTGIRAQDGDRAERRNPRGERIQQGIEIYNYITINK